MRLVAINSPSAGAVLTGATPVAIQVVPGAAPISTLSLQAGGQTLGTATASADGTSVTYNLDPSVLGDGQTPLVAVALDMDGSQVQSAPVGVTYDPNAPDGGDSGSSFVASFSEPAGRAGGAGDDLFN